MAKLVYDKTGRLEFTKEMTAGIHHSVFPTWPRSIFSILESVLRSYGYNAVLLQQRRSLCGARTGLKYVHNDTCYPALLVIGQFMISAINSGNYDLDRTALMITQTGGGCRASNYIHLLRKALHKAGYDKVPVISLNVSGLEKNSGFKLTLPLIRQAMAALVYGDMLMLLSQPGKAL